MAQSDVLINHPFPQKDLPLASLVCNLLSPNQDAYTDTAIDESDRSVEPYTGYSAVFENQRQALFLTAVSAFFSFTASQKSGEKIQVLTKKAQKYTLLNPQAQFRKLCKSESVREWIRDNYSRDLFMVVGYLTMTDATVVKRGSRGLQGGADAKVPSIAAVGDLNTRASAQIDQSSLDSVIYQANGEQVFSICYRKLKFSWFSKESTLAHSNRWKLFTSNRGSRVAAKSFVEIEVDTRDYVPLAPREVINGPEENYIIP